MPRISALDNIDEIENTDLLLVIDDPSGTPTAKNATIIDLLKVVYPVGTVYISGLSENPATYFGFGTWELNGPGRVIVCVNPSDTDFDAAGKTIGAKTHTLTSSEMPVHTHIQDAHTHLQNAHTHLQDSHNHNQDAHTHVQNPHNHTQDAHSHVITSQTATTGGATSYEHGTLDTSSAEAEATETTNLTTATNQATTAVNQNTTATNQATTAVNQSTTAVNQNATAVNQNAGGGAAHNNLQPSITAYVWKRTA